MKEISIIIVAALLAFVCACSGGGTKTEQPAYEPGTLTISLDYEKQSGYASNQFAVWVEDLDGNLIKTLYATRFTANGGFRDRPDSIPLWVEKSGLATMQKADADAVSGATPSTGTLYYTWDAADKDGNAVPAGEYRFFVEGSLRWKNRVLYSGAVDTGGGNAVVKAEAAYFYEGSDSQAALSADSPENKMLGNVTADWRR